MFVRLEDLDIPAGGQLYGMSSVRTDEENFQP